MECAITEHRQPWSRTPKVFHFRADPVAVEVLRAAHVDACSLANNHTLDFEEQGLLDTLAHLETAGIRYVGAGRNLEEAARPVLLEGGVALGAPWSEEGVTWSNQPAPTGAAASAASGSGYVEWAVTQQVREMYSGANNGFVIRDAAEGGGGILQSFHSREKAPDNPPELVITFN